MLSPDAGDLLNHGEQSGNGLVAGERDVGGGGRGRNERRKERLRRER